MLRSGVEFRPSEEADCDALAPRLRPADVAELLASSGRQPLDALRLSRLVSRDSWTVVQDGLVIGMLGHSVANPLGDTAHPWLLGSPGIGPWLSRHKRVILAYLDYVQETYPQLTNYVDARNTVSVRWLRHMGFTIKPPVPFGIGGEPFHPFHTDARKSG